MYRIPKWIASAIMLSLFSGPIVCSGEISEDTRKEIFSLVRSYYSAVAQEDIGALEKCLSIPQHARDTVIASYKVMFQTCDQEISQIKFVSLSINPGHERDKSGWVRLHVKGKVTRYDKQESFEVEQEFVGVLENTTDGWRLLRMIAADKFIAGGLGLLSNLLDKQMQTKQRMEWVRTQSPLIARKCQLLKSISIRIHSPVAGTVAVVLPQDTALYAGDTLGHVEVPGLDAEIHAATGTLESEESKLEQLQQEVRTGKSPQNVLAKQRELVAERRDKLNALLGRKQRSFPTSPLPGKVDAVIAKPGTPVAADAPFVGVAAAAEHTVLCFIRLDEEDRALLAKKNVALEDTVYCVQIRGKEGNHVLMAEVLALLDDPKSEELDLILGVPADQIPAWTVGAPSGIGVFAPPPGSRSLLPATAFALGVVMKQDPLDAEWLASAKQSRLAARAREWKSTGAGDTVAVNASRPKQKDGWDWQPGTSNTKTPPTPKPKPPSTPPPPPPATTGNPKPVAPPPPVAPPKPITRPPAQPVPTTQPKPATKPQLDLTNHEYFYSKKHDFWLPCPLGWKDRSAKATGEMVFQFTAPDMNAFVEAYIAEGGVVTPEQLADAFEQKVKGQMSNIQRRTQSAELVIDGSKALVREYAGSVEKQATTTYILFLPYKRRALIVVGVYVTATMEKYGKLVGKSILGVRLQQPR